MAYGFDDNIRPVTSPYTSPVPGRCRSPKPVLGMHEPESMDFFRSGLSPLSLNDTSCEPLLTPNERIRFVRGGNLRLHPSYSQNEDRTKQSISLNQMISNQIKPP